MDPMLCSFYWEGLFPDKKELNSHAVAAWVLGRLSAIERQKQSKAGS
jgi:hypothetical protein